MYIHINQSHDISINIVTIWKEIPESFCHLFQQNSFVQEV